MFKKWVLDTFVEVTHKDLNAISKDQKQTRKLIKKARVYIRQSKKHPWRVWVHSRKRSLAYA